jgi:hypothetical protein
VVQSKPFIEKRFKIITNKVLRGESLISLSGRRMDRKFVEKDIGIVGHFEIKLNKKIIIIICF